MPWEPKTAKPDTGWSPKTAQPDEESVKAPSEPGLSDKLGDRALSFLKTASDPKNTILDTGSEYVKQSAGALGDVEGSVAGALVPDFVKKYGKEAVGALADSAAGRAVGSVVKPVAEGVSQFAESHPSIAKPAAAAANVMGVAGGLDAAKGAGELVSRAAKEGPKFLAKTAEEKALVEAAQRTNDDVKKESQEAYALAHSKGAYLKEAWTDKALDELNKLKSQTPEGQAIAGETPLTKLLQRSEALRGKPISLKGAEEIDKSLTAEISTHWANGKLDHYGQQILDYQTKFREMVDSAGAHEVNGGKAGFDALKLARAKWSQAARMRDLENIMTRVSDNPKAVKNGFQALYNNKARLRGFTAEEQEAIRKAATSGTMTDLLHVLSNKGIAILHAATGGGIGGSALTYAGNKIAGSAEEALHKRAGQKIVDMVAGRKMPGTAEEAIGAVSDPLALSAPKSDFIIDESGKTRLQTPVERDAAIEGRQRLKEIGLTPDVMKAQDVNLANEMMKKYGQSELGRFVAENANKPISRQLFEIPQKEYSAAEADSMLRNANWEKLSKSQQETIHKQVEKLWNEHKTSVAEMIMEARRSAQYLAEATGQDGSTAMSEALFNAKRK